MSREEAEEYGQARAFQRTVLSGKLRLAFSKATNTEGQGVSSQIISALRPGNRLWGPYGRITPTCMYLRCKISRAPPLINMRTYPKWYLSISRSTMWRWSYQIYQVPQGDWKLRQFNCTIGSLYLDVYRRSLGSSLEIWLTG